MHSKALKEIIASILLLVLLSNNFSFGHNEDSRKEILSTEVKLTAWAQDTLKYCEGFFTVKNGVYIYDQLIPNADAATFQCLSDEYARDKNYVYFSGKQMPGVDVKTFEVLSHGYSKDSGSVYYEFYSGKKIKGADAKSFRVIDLSFSKDDNHVYYFKRLNRIVILKHAEAKTFNVFCQGCYRDRNYLFNCIGEIIKDTGNHNEAYIRALCSCEDDGTKK